MKLELDDTMSYESLPLHTTHKLQINMWNVFSNAQTYTKDNSRDEKRKR